MLLSVDPGVGGYLAVVNWQGVLCYRKIACSTVVIETAKTMRNKSRSQFNYTACSLDLRSFKLWAIQHQLDYAVVYEDTNPKPHQNINNTAVQLLGINLWPILCASHGIPCYSKLSNIWKKAEKLTQDKSKSLARLRSLCPSIETKSNHDLAEAILLGHHFLTKEKFDHGESNS